jgi:penicillin amidase
MIRFPAKKLTERRRRTMNRWLKILVLILVVIVVVGVSASLWLYRSVRQSLPILEGEVEVPGLSAPVIVERDEIGVPTIRGETRVDVSRALGFLHAQERFFQMDLMRRSAAGELAELFGEATVEADRASRLHRFRWRAQGAVQSMPPDHREILTAYTEGVNRGLEALDEKPFEYAFLRLDPEPWRNEDAVLVVYAMFFTLIDSRGRAESDLGVLHDVLPAKLAEFLAPPGTEWDAPILGEVFTTGSIPELEHPLGVDHASREASSAPKVGIEEAAAGSNNWAVAGSRAGHGRAILANDMHLGLAVPNTWYRAVLEWPGNDGCGPLHRVVGVTLPGTLTVTAGSNTHVAWGYTNSYGDWTDLVIVETDPDDPGRYLTPAGYRALDVHTETVAVRGGQPQTVEIRSTIWGPIIDQDHLGRPRALRWIAHDIEGVNAELLGLEHAMTVRDAQAVANRAGLAPQNFVCVDDAGSIGWTIAGRIPRRDGFTGRVPTSWADGERAWDGWLEPEKYPRVIDPSDGIIWTANARVVGGEILKVIGDGGYDLGARARQIRDDLFDLESPVEADMLAVQLDDRAVLMERWRDLLLRILTDEAVQQAPKRATFRDLVENTWTGRASVDSVAYRLVRRFRTLTFERVYGWLTAPCQVEDERFDISRLGQWEGPLWRLVTEQPQHLLDSSYPSWPGALLAAVDSTIEYFETEVGGGLERHTWGARNMPRIQHPLSQALPVLSRWLDMPRLALPGDDHVPRVQSPSWGASERMAVSPGHEEDGYFHMPGGQSGHPLSPHYRAGHQAWVDGVATPLLPGPPRTVLTLLPR